MSNQFLYDLQEDILDQKGYYILYALIFILSFIITIEEMKVYLTIFRIVLSGLALLFLVLIYLKCKSSRNEKENRRIAVDVLFFFMLTLVCIYQFIKQLH
ncbi:hypothetical protein [Clostridium lundense]|uniref:hypothetical protein n=1 Tax=Clostridium lundense TaxID=319475 RepID=UPI00048468A6|nr:hypothetical protein [Clostridium lundense]